jgi:hypothetical protein
MYFFAAAAVFQIFKSLIRGNFDFPLWAFAVFMFVAYLSFFSSLMQSVARYRVPIIPGIALLAGWGGALILKKWNEKN